MIVPVAGAGFVEPCLPSLARNIPSGPGWIHEIKHDGYRMLVCPGTMRTCGCSRSCDATGPAACLLPSVSQRIGTKLEVHGHRRPALSAFDLPGRAVAA